MRRSSRRRPTFVSAPLRLLVAFVLSLLAGDHLLPSLHHLSVEHELCPEHGKLEHVDGAPRERSHAPVGPTLDADSDEAAHHDDCDSVPASPPRAPLAAGFAEAFVPTLGEREPAVFVSRVARPVDVVSYAPKQSPPA